MNVRGERVLIFGDSLTHHGSDSGPEIWDVNASSARSSSAPGDLLASMLLEAGAQAVRTNARVGRSAMNFYSRENAAQLLSSDVTWHPTKVIVMLGTNDIGRDAAGTKQAMTAIRDAYRATGAEVWAIGPVLYVGKSEALNASALPVIATMKSVFGGRFIDARYLTEEAGATTGRAADGVHFGAAAAKQLATVLADVVKKKVSPTIWWTIAAVVGGAAAAGGLWFYWSRRSHAEFGVVHDNAQDEAIAYAIKDSASRAGKVGGRKVFISDLFRQLQADGRDDGMTLPEFKRELLRLNRAGYIELSRADLVAAFPQDKVSTSETDANGATYHFLTITNAPLGGLFSIDILRHENKWIRINGNPKASGYKQIPCKSGLDKKNDPLFRVRCWSK